MRRVRDLAPYIGQQVEAKIIELDKNRNNVVLSRRAWLEQTVSLSLKATQEDPWQHFARTHVIGQIVPGKVTKLVPFGAFVRVEDGIEGLVHISELAVRHVDLPEQVVSVDETIYVKVIDIDLERRRISLSLKQANETATAADVEEFDPTLYGMTASYDEQGNYIYPDGFDPETGEVAPGATTSSARPGRSSTPRRTLAGRRTSRSRTRPSRPRSRPARRRRTAPAAPTRPPRRPRSPPAARSPRTRRCRRCARS